MAEPSSAAAGSARPVAWADVAVGQSLPQLALPPLTRLTLALYCGGSGDHNAIHVDSDYAKEAGLPDVIAHGMLGMAWLARVLTNWAPQSALREYGVRFTAMTRVGEQITCKAVVTEIFERPPNGQAQAPERCARLELHSANAQGEIKLSGWAVVGLG